MMRGLSLTLKLTRRVSNVFEIEVRTTLCAGCLSEYAVQEAKIVVKLMQS